MYPDGSSFLVAPEKVDVANHPTESVIETKCEPSVPYTSLSSPTSMTAAAQRREERTKIESLGANIAARSSPERDIGASVPQSPIFDVDAINKKNRRKLDILSVIDSTLGGFDGNEDDPLTESIFEQMQHFNSRPSSTGSSRPGTIPSTTQNFPMPNRPLSSLARWGAAAIDSNSKINNCKTYYSDYGMQGIQGKMFLSKDSLVGSTSSSQRKIDYSIFGL